MKRIKLIGAAIVVIALCSTPLLAGNIPAFTPFNAGDTLSATTMNTRFNDIRAAVNDNDTRMPGIEFIDTNVASPITGTEVAVASITVTAPAAGFLFVNAFGNIACDVAGSDRVVLRNDTDNVTGLFLTDDNAANVFKRYSVSHVFPVTAGSKVMQVLSRCTGGTAGTINVESFSAIFLPRRL